MQSAVLRAGRSGGTGGGGSPFEWKSLIKDLANRSVALEQENARLKSMLERFTNPIHEDPDDDPADSEQVMPLLSETKDDDDEAL